MRMRYLLVLFAVFAAFAQTPKTPPAPEDLPANRVADTYSVYEAALANPIWDHSDNHRPYFIASATGQTYGVEGPEQCVSAPESEQQRFREAVQDYNGQKGKVFRVEDRFTLDRPFRLINEDQQRQISDKLFRGTPPKDPSLKDATDIITVGNVAFSKDRSLAMVVISNYCGGLCGGEKWRIFKRGAKGWVEKNWGRCSIIS